MYRKWLLLAGVADLFILSLLDKIAFRHYFYWRFRWFDVLMHLIGGVAIGLVSAFAYWEWRKETHPAGEATNDHKTTDWKSFFIFNLVFILAAGIGWEIFEVLADRIVRFNGLNSLSDLAFGVVGSLLAGLLAVAIYLWIQKWEQKK